MPFWRRLCAKPCPGTRDRVARVAELADGKQPSICILPAWEATIATTATNSGTTASGLDAQAAELQAVEATIAGACWGGPAVYALAPDILYSG